MDIRAGFIAASILLSIWAIAVFRSGLFSFRSATKLNFYRLKRSREAHGRWLILLSLGMIALAIALPIFGQPVVYKVFPPTPTAAPTLTPSAIPSATISPTLTLSPTITPTLLYTYTPLPTGTPFLPLPVEAQFISAVTPNPGSVISELQFATRVDGNGFCQSPGEAFRNPLGRLFACFQYNNMTVGAQWTALWFRDGELFFYETYPWDGSTGGIYYSECAVTPDQWQPGNYSVQIYVGQEFKRGGVFSVEGQAPTAAPTLPPTLTPGP